MNYLTRGCWKVTEGILKIVNKRCFTANGCWGVWTWSNSVLVRRPLHICISLAVLFIQREEVGVKEPVFGGDRSVNDCAAFGSFAEEGGSAIKMLFARGVILLNGKIMVGN